LSNYIDFEEDEMKKVKVTCHICGNVMKSEEALVACTKCGANLANPREETVQKQVHCQYTTGTLGGWTGWLYLTNKRLVWIKDGNAVGGGLVGALIDSAAGGGKLGFSIPLEELVLAEESKIGLLAKAIAIKTKDGAEGKLGISKRDEWLNALRHVIAD
jgi:ribosomal protein S27E